MKIYKVTEASEYLGVSINTLKALANNGKINFFKTTGIVCKKLNRKFIGIELNEEYCELAKARLQRSE